MEKNIPYVKERDSEGNVTNPITVTKPYLHTSSSTRQIRRGNERIQYMEISGQLQAFVQKRVRSSKRTRDWI